MIKSHCKGQHYAVIIDAVTEALQTFCEWHQVYKRAEEAMLASPGEPVGIGTAPCVLEGYCLGWIDDRGRVQ